MATAQAVFVDDDPSFIRTMAAWQKGVHMKPLATTDVDQGLKWVREEDSVGMLIADLRMPALDGVSLLEEAKAIKPSLRGALLTANQPTSDEDQRLRKIESQTYLKVKDLESFLESLARGEITTEPTERLPELQQRIAELEALNRELVADLLEQLAAIPNGEVAVVHEGSQTFTVQELLRDIEFFEPRGIEHVRLWKNALRTVRLVKGRQ